MNPTATAATTFPVDVELAGRMTEALASQVQRWSGECQRFLAWQRLCFVTADDPEALRARHQRALQRLLGLGRMLNAATSDPEFMDRRAAEMVKARMAQLQECFELSHPVMSADEAEALLRASLGS